MEKNNSECKAYQAFRELADPLRASWRGVGFIRMALKVTLTCWRKGICNWQVMPSPCEQGRIGARYLGE